MAPLMEITSKHMIKPSIPTPPHLSSHGLSFLDQFAPSHYFPLIFFYQSNKSCNPDRSRTSEQLKSSFSVALTKFYPLAGRINTDCFCVDCNDAGALYIAADVHADLSEVMKKVKTKELNKYLPLNPHGENEIYENVLLAVRVNFFECGGIAIGVCMSHKVADGTSLVMFMSSWAAICRADAESVPHPDFSTGSILFPPQKSRASEPGLSIIKEEKFVAKRLIFGKEKLAEMKKFASDFGVKEATRVEAVTAFLWKRFMDAGNSEPVGITEKKKYVALHALNLRPRMNPPLPDHTFGNMWSFVLACSDKAVDEYRHLLVDLRNGMRRVLNEKRLGCMMESQEFLSSGMMEICTFSSWCRFPIYEVDFGQGKPVWVCTSAIPFKNAVILMPTRDGEGVEAWVNMVEHEFERLNKDEDFTSGVVCR